MNLVSVAVGLTPKVADVCGGGCSKCACSISANSASSGPSRSPRRDGKDRARAGALSAADQEGILISCLDVADTSDHGGIVFDVSRYGGGGGVGYCSSAAASLGRVAVMLLSCVPFLSALVNERMWMSSITKDRANTSIFFGWHVPV